jgi:hypothetical protein
LADGFQQLRIDQGQDEDEDDQDQEEDQQHLLPVDAEVGGSGLGMVASYLRFQLLGLQWLLSNLAGKLSVFELGPASLGFLAGLGLVRLLPILGRSRPRAEKPFSFPVTRGTPHACLSLSVALPSNRHKQAKLRYCVIWAPLPSKAVFNSESSSELL